MWLLKNFVKPQKQANFHALEIYDQAKNVYSEL